MSNPLSRSSPNLRAMTSGERHSVVVAAVDFTLIVAVVIAGLVSHDSSPLSNPLAAIETVVPFAVGWGLVAGLLGLYRQAWLSDLAASLRTVVAAWLGAVGVGLVLRTSPTFDGGATWPFGLVIVGSVLVVLVPWRLLAWRALAPDR